MHRLSRPPGPAPATARVRLRTRLRRDRTMLLLVLPGFLFFVLFHYVPLLGNVIVFQDYQPYLGFRGSPWVGLGNFARVRRAGLLPGAVQHPQVRRCCSWSCSSRPRSRWPCC